MNGQVLTDKEAVLNAWEHHFEDLSSSKASGLTAPLSNLDAIISTYWNASFHNEDLIFDCDITTEDVERISRR